MLIVTGWLLINIRCVLNVRWFSCFGCRGRNVVVDVVIVGVTASVLIVILLALVLVLVLCCRPDKEQDKERCQSVWLWLWFWSRAEGRANNGVSQSAGHLALLILNVRSP